MNQYGIRKVGIKDEIIFWMQLLIEEAFRDMEIDKMQFWSTKHKRLNDLEFSIEYIKNSTFGLRITNKKMSMRRDFIFDSNKKGKFAVDIMKRYIKIWNDFDRTETSVDDVFIKIIDDNRPFKIAVF